MDGYPSEQIFRLKIFHLQNFYAAVIRKDAKSWPDNGYQIENGLTKEEAIRGMTIWAAKSNFEENEKGSIEKREVCRFYNP